MGMDLMGKINQLRGSFNSAILSTLAKDIEKGAGSLVKEMGKEAGMDRTLRREFAESIERGVEGLKESGKLPQVVDELIKRGTPLPRGAGCETKAAWDNLRGGL